MTVPAPDCPLCHQEGSEKYLQLPDRFQPEGELYHLYRCPACGFIFLHPRPAEEEMERYYTDEKYDSFAEVEGPVSLRQRIYSRVKPWALKWKARLVEKQCPEKGQLLDVGAGTGAFLKVMKQRNWETLGVEKSEKAARYGREVLTLNLLRGDLADCDLHHTRFEAITFWHSLEHIHRFRENLKIVSESLSPEGRLFLALPNPASLEAKIYRRRWVAYDVPRHLWHFPPPVMERMLEAQGFRLLKMVPMPLDPFYNGLLSEMAPPAAGKFFRLLLRLPIVSATSFLAGATNPIHAASIVYIAARG